MDTAGPKLLVFCGKGGVGKTTVSCATALHFARQEPPCKILLASTDPAHSLADSFGLAVQGENFGIDSVSNLVLHQMDSARALSAFKEKYGVTIKTLALRGTYFDNEDVDLFLSLSLPGLDEVMAILEIMQWVRDNRYDRIVLDCAPTGHFLRLLSCPALLENLAHVLEGMQAKYKFIAGRFLRGKPPKDACDEFLERLKEDAQSLWGLFKDSRRSEFIPVTIAEAMSVLETKDLLAALKEHSIPSRRIIVNRLQIQELCPYCRQRKDSQQDALDALHADFPEFSLQCVPLFEGEVHGIEGLGKVAEILFDSPILFGPPDSPTTPPPDPPPNWGRDKNHILKLLRQIGKGSNSVWMIGGKGGVGKTTVSTLLGLWLAKKHPKSNILLFSTDPAHSLADSLGVPVGEEITSIEGLPNLYAQQIDCLARWEKIKREYRQTIEEVFGQFLGKDPSFEIRYDKEVLTNLISMIPPGVDELVSLKEVVKILEEKKFDYVVLDSAPTGHLLRFLELPALMKTWVDVFFKIVDKYSQVLHLGKTTHALLQVSKAVSEVADLFRGNSGTQSRFQNRNRVMSPNFRFVAVTIPEEVALAETQRLVAELKRLEVPCRDLVVNMLLPAGLECKFCAGRFSQQQASLDKIRRTFSAQHIHTMNQFPQPACGISFLINFCSTP